MKKKRAHNEPSIHGMAVLQNRNKKRSETEQRQLLKEEKKEQ